MSKYNVDAVHGAVADFYLNAEIVWSLLSELLAVSDEDLRSLRAYTEEMLVNLLLTTHRFFKNTTGCRVCRNRMVAFASFSRWLKILKIPVGKCDFNGFKGYSVDPEVAGSSPWWILRSKV